MPPSRATSYRLDPQVKDALEAQARAEGISERALLERLVREGLATLRHPGIVYRDGPSGRRAALAAGADVWEIVSALRHTKGREAQRIAQLAEQFGVHPTQIRIALDFAAMHRDEIDERVAANDAAAEQVRLLSEGRAKLMAS
ncbi:hypothetical protein [Sporichthya polymorpha]|uniref:hypothetical protein n=1 Tax=Sporichthya polymorpha TaxID=35751 RepID=UPI00038277AF|nr:hypothetical protein [Sporichthya polymorpha]